MVSSSKRPAARRARRRQDISKSTSGEHQQTLQHDPNPHRLYRPGRLAELFGVDRTTIWRWSRSGVIPPLVRVGGISGLTERQLQQVLSEREGPR